MTYKGHLVTKTLIRSYFSPIYTTGQKYIYTGSSDGNVYIYDVLTGCVVAKLKGHSDIIRDLSWHPFEPLIVSTSWDGTLGKWDQSSEPKVNLPKKNQIAEEEEEHYIDDDF